MILLLPVGGLAAAPEPAPASGQPLLFVENVGQFASPVRFQLALRGATLFLAEDGLWLVVGEATEAEAGPARQAAVRLSFPGANARPQLVPQGRLPTHMAYFVGSDPRGWHADVPVWAGVRYRELYPGVDLELASMAGALDLRLIARPGANLAAVRMRASGADHLAAGARELRMQTGVGELSLPLPRLLGADGRALPLAGAGAQVLGDTISAPFARAEALPATRAALAAASLEYSSFYGGSARDEGDAVAVGPDGAAYIGGWTNASNFPGVTGTFGADGSGIEAVVIKLEPTPNALPSYVVVAGGGGPDYVSGIAVDGSGAAYVVGYTASSNFPTQNGFDTDGSGVDSDFRDAFVLKLSPSGSQLAYSTYAGGSADERGFEIAVDQFGAAYITGRTTSTDFPTTPGAFDTTAINSLGDAYALKIGPQGGLAYGTYLGGSKLDQGNDIVVDGDGAAYVTGYAISDDFPAPNGFDSAHNGLEDAFVVKLSASGGAIEYGTFVGGGANDRGNSIVVDGAGAAYVAGFSLSNNFPAQPTSYDRESNGLADAVVFKLAPNGKSLNYATYLGGGADDFAEAIAIGNQGQAYVVGTTLSANFPLKGALDSTPNDSTDIFVAALSPTGAELTYGSYLGGKLIDSADGMALDASGDLVITGFSESSDFPIGSGPVDGSYNGDHDIILVRLALGTEPADPVFTISGTIRDASNNPLPNITVQTNGGRSTTTGDDGVYRLVGLPAGGYRVTPVQTGLTFQPPFHDVIITTSNVGGKNFDVPVSTFSITGRVRNKRTGQGVSNALVRAGANYTATSDGNGNYRFEGLPAGSYTLGVSHNSYSFEPKQRQVTLASNLAGQNFDALDLNKVFASGVTFAKLGACQPDAFEPNDQRYPSANLQNSRLQSNVQIRANLCEGDPNEEDNYLFHVNQPGSVQLQLNFPASYRNKVAVLIYYVDPQKVDPQNPDDLTVQRCHNASVAAQIWTPAQCDLPGKVFTSSGDYIVRVYLETTEVKMDPYLLVATFN